MIKENKAIKFIKFMKDNYCEEEENSFCDGLLSLRGQANWRELDSEFLNHLIEMLSIVKKNSHNATIIENIVEIECFDFNNNQELLDEYIFLLEEKATLCLSAFIISGVNEGEIFNKIYKSLDKKHAIEILEDVSIDRECLENISNELEEFYAEFQIAKK